MNAPAPSPTAADIARAITLRTPPIPPFAVEEVAPGVVALWDAQPTTYRHLVATRFDGWCFGQRIRIVDFAEVGDVMVHVVDCTAEQWQAIFAWWTSER